MRVAPFAKVLGFAGVILWTVGSANAAPPLGGPDGQRQQQMYDAGRKAGEYADTAAAGDQVRQFIDALRAGNRDRLTTLTLANFVLIEGQQGHSVGELTADHYIGVLATFRVRNGLGVVTHARDNSTEGPMERIELFEFQFARSSDRTSYLISSAKRREI